MKFKLMNQEAIYLAGVVHYGPLEKRQVRTNRGPSQERARESFQIEVAQIKDNAKKMQENFKETMKGQEDPSAKGSGEEERAYTEGFESAMRKLGERMEKIGRYVEDNAPKWEKNMNDWGEHFSKKMDDWGEGFNKSMNAWSNNLDTGMETWGENFSKNMDTWGEHFSKNMAAWGETFEEGMETWGKHMEGAFSATETADGDVDIKDYPIYDTYRAIHETFIAHHPDHIKAQNYYEVQIFDQNIGDGVTMVMVGGRMRTLEAMTYPVATMTFKPDRWVAVKMSREEFAKDWLDSLKEAAPLSGYVIGDYFIWRHRKEGDAEIRLFCPLMVAKDEG